MDPRLRQEFNGLFSDELYGEYRRTLEGMIGEPIGFRLAETPLFLDDDLRQHLERTSDELIAQLSTPEMTARLSNVVPPDWRVPNLDFLPHIATVDFAIVRDKAGHLIPKLIELQGFPSLNAFEVFQRDAWSQVLDKHGMKGPWSCWFSGLDRESFIDLLGRTLLGGCDPRDVVLVDVDPETQKTKCDFAATRKLLGIETVGIESLVREGRRLFRRVADGTLREVRRIHNRAIPDELIRKQSVLPFAYTDDLDVDWVPHPNWYWIWSKYAVMFLDHPSIPESVDLSRIDRVPEDFATGWVLKPLFSFAGGGVVVDPTPADVETIPENERSLWCLQRKVDYAPALEAIDGGGVKAEVRMMYLRPDDESELILAENLVRLSRGKMLGVDYNRDYTWVGSSIGLYQP